MTDAGSITQLLCELKAGGQAAQQELWNRYFARLVRLARTMLRTSARRAADEEDAALSAMNAFFRGVHEGRFPTLDDRTNLWPLLVRITAHPTAQQSHRESRKKRGGGRVRGESALNWNQSQVNAIEAIVGDEPTPELAVQVAEQCDVLLRLLTDDSQRTVARLKLEGYTNQEIAKKIDRAERTVEWKLKLIRQTWEEWERENVDD
jgi:DNA-directed RNA polymerase specialized sigma24 family protein